VHVEELRRAEFLVRRMEDSLDVRLAQPVQPCRDAETARGVVVA
jgi:hypothetical protein